MYLLSFILGVVGPWQIVLLFVLFLMIIVIIRMVRRPGKKSTITTIDDNARFIINNHNSNHQNQADHTKQDTITQLEKLQKLRESNVLSEEEFQAQKAKILNN